MYALSHLVLVGFVVIALIAPINALKFLQSNKIQSSTALFGSHHLGRYGSFVDTLQRPRNKAMEEMYKDLNLPTKVDAKNGADLRKERTRNLKTYHRENPYDVIKTPLKPLNFDLDTILSIVSTLNLSLEGKDRSELTTEERVGVIDW